MIENDMFRHYAYPLCVFMNNAGDVVVKDLDEARALDDPEWRHIGSIEPKGYIQNILNKNPKLVRVLLNVSKT